MGSYRRGKDKCGDVDILITPTGPMSVKSKKGMTRHQLELLEIKDILQTLVDHLMSTGLVNERLGSNRISKTGSETFWGICKLPGADGQGETPHRRIDIKVFPRS